MSYALQVVLVLLGLDISELRETLIEGGLELGAPRLKLRKLGGE